MYTFRIFIMALVTLLPQYALSHPLDPGYLEITAVGPDKLHVNWRRPSVQNSPMAINVLFPQECIRQNETPLRFDGAGWIADWDLICEKGLVGQRISIKDLSATKTDVLVRYTLYGKKPQTERLTAEKTSFIVPKEPTSTATLYNYFTLGVEHILGGIDHLLFVFALLLLITDRWRLVVAITSFTLAHSITLTLASLEIMTLPGPPVEAVIALSIMFLASELLQRNTGTLRFSERSPWIVAFSFGLLHGFGFAGALLDIGLPQNDVFLALLAFNFGVEAGQILFITVILLAALTFKKLNFNIAKQIQIPQNTSFKLTAYSIGSLSAFWFIERMAAF